MWHDLPARIRRHLDLLLAALLFLFSFTVYLRTLAPSVVELFDDSLEFQLIASRMAIAHPTGYPLYSILLKLFSFLPFGDVAYRANLSSALYAALAVALVYGVVRQLNASRLAAVIGAGVFAFGPVFWSQAVVAEVYALQAALTGGLLFLALLWRKQQQSGKTGGRKISLREPTLVTLAFFFGLMLTHHRQTLLLAPALAVYVLAADRGVLRRPRTLPAMALAFAVPLLLYLYLPLRGLFTSSLDGAYQNTLPGFIGWVTGSAYNVFISENPFNEQREFSFYLGLFLQQFTWAGLGLAALGLLSLARRQWREALLLSLGLVANLVFAINYRVADVQVFFIPAFLFVALLLAVGVDGVGDFLSAFVARGIGLPRLARYAPVGLLIFLLLPAWLLNSNYSSVDLSAKWDVHDRGLDLAQAPLPPNSTLIGIGGEMSLWEYFQEQGFQREVETVRADKEGERLAAVARALDEGRTVFLTRPLPGAAQRYSLASFGPLILVQREPNTTTAASPAHTLNQDFDGVRLLGYDLDASRLQDSGRWHLSNGRVLRVTLYWQVERATEQDRRVSLKLLDPNGGRAAQIDLHPVDDAYPTTAWRVGEYLSDTYDLPVLIGAAAGEYTLQATLYDAASGDVFGQAELQKITLGPDTIEHPPQVLGVERPRRQDFGGAVLQGYSLDASEPYALDSSVPITLLWRLADMRPHALELTLIDSSYQVVTRLPLTVQSAATEEYVRQELSLPLKAPLPPGPLTVELDRAPRDVFRCDLPLLSSCAVLGTIQHTGEQK